MAKQAATKAAEAPAAPAPTFEKANPTADPNSVDVVKWDNGLAVSEHAEPIAAPVEAEEAAQPSENKPAVEPEDKTPAETPAAKEEEAEEAVEAKPAKPVVSDERRRQIVESLAAERSKRAMEKQIADAKKTAEDATKAQAEFDALPLAQKLKIVATKHGMSVQDLADRLLIDADDVRDAQPVAKVADPEVAALKAKVEELTKVQSAAQEAEAKARVQQAVGQVQAALKDVDLPLIDTFDAYSRVMVRAHEAWSAGGKQGTPMDFVPDVAPVVEDELKAEYPKAAARLYPKAAETAQEEAGDAEAPAPAAKPPARVVAGKRIAARPEAKPKSVWEGGKTAAEVDAQIKKELGWG